LFGDGSDGDAVITTNTTLARDMYYRNLTIDSGDTLNPGGYRIFVAGTLTLDNSAAIARNGLNGAGSTGGAGLSAGTLGGSEAGGNATAIVPDEPNSLGGSGGDATGCRGGGRPTPPAPGVGGTGVFRQAFSALSGRSLDGALVNGGAGGGACGTSAGGSGGGVIVVVARTIAVNGSARIIAKGGAGVSDGGGGGGGVVVVITTSPQPPTLTLSADGGTGGGGGGVFGTDGGPGFTDWLN
jgi:hypothetical protein